MNVRIRVDEFRMAAKVVAMAIMMTPLYLYLNFGMKIFVDCSQQFTSKNCLLSLDMSNINWWLKTNTKDQSLELYLHQENNKQ